MMPQALDVTVLIGVFKGPQDETQTCMLVFIFFELSRRMFLLRLPGSNSSPPPQEYLGKGAQICKTAKMVEARTTGLS